MVSDGEHRREQDALEAFTKRGAGPRATFALVLVSIAIAAISLSMDEVERYSSGAFAAGLAGAVLCALAIGWVMNTVKDSVWRTVAILFLPTVCGAALGVMIQAVVLADVGTGWDLAVKDLGGLVDTTRPIGWLMGGIVLGGLPALLVSGFLLLAARGLSKLVGHDASENFGVAYVGGAGLLAGVGLFLVKGMAVPPLFLVSFTSGVTVLVALLIDGSRISFLRKVYARTGEGFDIVPATHFAHDPTLAPMVARARTGAILVRLAKGEYRANAMQPIALVADSEAATLRPLLERRFLGTAILIATFALTTLALLVNH